MGDRSSAFTGRLERSLIARLFRRAQGDLVLRRVGDREVLELDGQPVPQSIEFRVERTQSWVWTDLTIYGPSGTRRSIAGLRRAAGRTAEAILVAHFLVPDVSRLLQEFEWQRFPPRFLGIGMFDDWIARARPVVEHARRVRNWGGLNSDSVRVVLKLLAIFDGGENSRQQRNDRFVAAQRVLHQQRLMSAQGHPLNDEQINAILYDEDRALVVAGAGSGKTSTIIGKVDYILAAGLAAPEELLLMAFTKKAAEEMRQRLKRVTGADIAVRTFHAFGLEVYSEAYARRPSLSRLAEDGAALSRALQDFIDKLLDDSATCDMVIDFLAFFRYPLRSDESFKSQHEKHQYAKGHELRDLRGTRMKSVQETIIANWFLLHGIEYEYERDYEHPTASVQYRQYRPDFYLPRYRIYIEHFGVDRNGKPPAFFTDPGGYEEGMRWKRNLHREKGTTLLETFSYQAFEHTLLSSLAAALKAKGVEIQRISKAEAVSLVRKNEAIPTILVIMKSFLKLFKGNAWTIEALRERVRLAKDERTERFVAVFEVMFRMYQATLKAEMAIDFDDMIVEAAGSIERRAWKSRFSYVIVDEFQDISAGRAKILCALLNQVPSSKLFCVGDDWQSIYRFTGSDIELMTRFETHFGRFRRTDLRQTHRFGSRLLEATSKFVMANPQQLSKQLSPVHRDDEPAIEIHSTGANSDDVIDLTEVFQRIRLDAASRPAKSAGGIDILLLGRYQFTGTRKRVYQASPDLAVTFMTAHGAKGLEADYVIVLDVVGGRYGFPTEIEDDALLELVLAARVPFPNSEERRLFYVAMTRARRRTYLVTHDSRRSIFIDELEGSGFAGLVVASGAALRIAACPLCAGGRLERRQGEFGQFFGCSNYPVCRGKATACPCCGEGAFVKIKGEFVCHAPKCGERRQCCPTCQQGYLKIRSGRHGDFLGCTEWRHDARLGSCCYTRQC